MMARLKGFSSGFLGFGVASAFLTISAVSMGFLSLGVSLEVFRGSNIMFLCLIA